MNYQLNQGMQLAAAQGVSQERPKPEVDAELDYLRNALDQLESAAVALVGRAMPVLRGSAPAVSAAGTPVPPPLPPQAVVTTVVGTQLKDLRQTVLSITAAINDAYERMEV